MKSDADFLQPGDQIVVHTVGGKQVYRFRRDPVPGKNWVWKNRGRHYRTIRERRAYSDRELAAYARAGRVQKLDALFEVYRDSERNWKSHRKNQWK